MRILSAFRDSFPFFLFGLLALLAPRIKFWALTHTAPLAWLYFLLGFVFALRSTIGKASGENDRASNRLKAMGSRLFSGKTLFGESPVRGSAVGKIIIILFPVVAFLLFFSFRQRIFLPPPRGLGDSLLLIQTVPVFSHLFGYLDSFDELLELYIHSRFYLFSSQAWHISIEESYALLSSLAGAGYVLLIILYLRSRTPAQKIYGGALLLMTPALQLYAGYVENYTFVSLVISLVLILGVQALQSESNDENCFFQSPLFLPLLALLSALAALLHLIAGFLAPALAYLVWIRSGRKIGNFAKKASLATLPALLLMAGVWTIFFFLFNHPPSLGDSHLSHPPLLRPRRILSLAHIRDLLNQLLMGAPLALPLFFALRPTRFFAPVAEKTNEGLPVRPRLTEGEIFLLLAGGSFSLAAFVMNPMLGFPADWDLLTLFQIPLNLLLLQLLFRPPTGPFSFPFDSRRLPNPTALFVLGALLTFSWIGHNSRSSAISERYRDEAHQTGRLYLDSIAKDTVFSDVVPAVRKKLYVRIGLFILDSRLFLERENETALIKRLDRAGADFRRIMILPDDAYARELPLLWKELTRINKLITARRRANLPGD